MTKKKARNQRIKKDNYQEITDMILEKLDAGEIPWRSPVITRIPQNLFSTNNYRGINALMLWNDPESTYKVYATFKQYKENGGAVKKGAKARPVYFFKMYKFKETNAAGETEEKEIPLLKTYLVFPIEMTTLKPGDYLEVNDFKDQEKKAVYKKIEAALQKLWSSSKVTFSNGGRCGSYNFLGDHISVPHKENYKDLDSYYSTIFHELGHATGHNSRLARDLKSYNQDKHSYSFEELVAELTASMLCAYFGIVSEGLLENKAAYIGSWKKVISADKKMVYQAASKAQKAVDWILERMGEIECPFEKEVKAQEKKELKLSDYLEKNNLQWGRYDSESDSLYVWTPGYKTAQCYEVEARAMSEGYIALKMHFDQHCGKTQIILKKQGAKNAA
jgi:antirestriction protein ArdC